MATDIGDILEAVWERSFYHQRAKIRVFSGEGPDLFRRSGIADMKQGRVLRLDKKSNRRHDVTDLDRGNGMASDLHGSTLAQAAQSQHRSLLGGARDAGKVRPHLIVEKGLGQAVDDAADAPDVNGSFGFSVEIIRQGPESHDVIQMDVSHQYISDFPLRRETQRRGGATRINEQRIFDQERGEIVAWKLAS
jgi:hypothetical protein